MTIENGKSRRRGLTIGWPVAIGFIGVWALSVFGFAHHARRNIELSEQLLAQAERIEAQDERIAHLEDRLRILEAIEDLQTRLSPDEEVQLASDVYSYSSKYEVPPLLVVAMIKVESSFGARAVSHMGARGLLQVKPSTGRWVAQQVGWDWPGDDRLFDPQFNLRLGTRYLSTLIKQFGSVEKAVIAYNWGETAVRESIVEGRDLPRGYLERVLNTYHRLKAQYGPKTARVSHPTDECL